VIVRVDDQNTCGKNDIERSSVVYWNIKIRKRIFIYMEVVHMRELPVISRTG
jgi:hypothetical protein